MAEIEFRFLELNRYNNEPHFRRFAQVEQARRAEATVVMPVQSPSQAFFDHFVQGVIAAVAAGRYLPIARFCDGEYAFYSGREITTCWGERNSNLRQPGVESLHLRALSTLSENGILCPNLNLVYQKVQSGFLQYLSGNGLPLRNYAPFYFVYALLVHPAFLSTMRGRHVALITHLANKNVPNILARLAALGIEDVGLYDIPDSGVAHGQFELRLDRRPDVALVGAGIGSPLILERLKEHGCVGIDSGFVFHLWDGTFDRHERLFLNYE